MSSGGIVQLNASSVRGSWGIGAKRQWKKLINLGLAHIISSDAHNLDSRPPELSVCLEYLKEHCSENEIDLLTRENARRVVCNQTI